MRSRHHYLRHQLIIEIRTFGGFIMTPDKAERLKIKELNEALEFAQEIEQKLQEFDISSAKVAEKWQNKVEDRVKKTNN